MAKATCEKHKRFVPTCDPCKSAALKETVGFPKAEATPPADEPASDVDETTEHVEEEDGGGDIAEWEPEVEPEVADDLATELPSYVPTGAPAEEPVVEGGVSLPGELRDPLGEPEIPAPTQMSPLEMAVAMFPPRLMSQEVAPFVEKTLAAYMELGLTAEDAVIVTAGEVIHAEQLTGLEPEVEEEVEEAFDAGLEAAPEITGCIEDYNQGYNDGLKALRTTLRDYYAGDEDSVAYELGLWLDKQMRRMQK